MKCNQICKWNSNVGCVKPCGVPCILENVSPTVRKATNADRIRAMSDEELAVFLWEFEKEEIARATEYALERRKITEWLKQPADLSYDK